MSDAALQTDFAGRRGRLFRLALKTSLLTVLTLGFYRFWMKTRLRRYYWSSIRPGGVPLEYAGLGTEKLLGFLIAVVFMAFYIGVVNLLLMFASFAVLQGNGVAYLFSLVGVIPIIFFAQYRARRYVLARTRWRGIRFGLEPGAWGYAWRALGHWLLTILTLGLLWPRKTFWLEKYRTDRTRFGTQPLVQEGRWTMLLRPFLPVVLGVAGIAVAVILGAGGIYPAFAALAPLAVFTVWAVIHWRVASFRQLANHKRAGRITFRARPRTGRVARIYVLGWLAIGLMLALVGIGFLVALALVAEQVFGSTDPVNDFTALARSLPRWATVVAAVVFYFTAFILLGVLTHVFLTMPLLRHYAETFEIDGAGALPRIAQRGRDEFAEAEGFAEALDVGAAI